MGVYAVANWDEAGTKHGAFFTFAHLRGQSRLLVGPGTHCGWTQVKTDTGFDIVAEELRFFDYWLKGVRNDVMEEPAVTYFTYNAPPESAWRRAASWPLPNEQRTTFYLGDKTLTRDKPTGASRDGVSFNRLAETATSTTGPRETASENVISYETPVLTADMEVTGHPAMHLWIAADAPDADIVARLEDVAPDASVRSYNMHGQFRASHRARAKAPYDTFGLPWHSHAAADAKPLAPGDSCGDRIRDAADVLHLQSGSSSATDAVLRGSGGADRARQGRDHRPSLADNAIVADGADRGRPLAAEGRSGGAIARERRARWLGLLWRWP